MNRRTQYLSITAAFVGFVGIIIKPYWRTGFFVCLIVWLIIIVATILSHRRAKQL